ncbi:WD40 repeat-like protein [Ceratobasidium sp. AG-I]|nr:WD40 repeat-like protein [Ceratobasidium sp. AG-I]
MRDTASKKGKNKPAKPPTSRAVGTSALAQPSLSSPASRLSSFSPDGTLFAFVSLAVDKHRVRVYDVSTGSAVADHTFDGVRATALSWGAFELVDGQSKANKKRRKRKSIADELTESSSSAIQLIALGLSDGSIALFSPTQGAVVRTLSNPSHSAAITSIAPHNDSLTKLWAASEDSTIRCWDIPAVTSRDVATSTPCVVLAPRPGITETKDGVSHLLAAQTTIQLLPIPADSIAQTELVTVPGHASPVTTLAWDRLSSEPAQRFVSAAEGDRVVSIWDATNGRMVASVPLDSDARHVAFGADSTSTLLALAVSGKVSLYTLPEKPATTTKSKLAVSALSPRAVVSVEYAGKKGADPVAADVVAAAFVLGDEGKVVLARLVGVKPVFDTVQYRDDNGNFLPEVKLTHKSATAGLAADTNGVVPTKRYAEPQSLSVRSGAELAQDPSEAQPTNSAADLDVELAEITLDERNKALASSSTALSEKSTSTSQKRRHDSPSADDAAADTTRLPVPAHSLSRTLAQALHSGDNALLETCLAHGDATLIRNTVLRLPPTLCVPLLQACVERLGRGARGEKGGGAGASAQRGTSLIRWVRAVLVVHSGFLMTIPDLVARLSTLHSTLAARLALQDKLLALNGRLDLVLSQIEMQSAPRAGVDEDVVVKKKKVRRKAARYVEGESESDENMSVDGEDDEDDEGSVEDIGFGSDDEDDDDDEEDESEEEESDDEDGPKLNGFIDDEAEEDYSEDEESSAEE